MAPVSNNFVKNTHVSRLADGRLQFDAYAVEVTVLDRRGHAMWKMTRADDHPPLVWNGVDMYGTAAEPGAYTCKIVYADRQIIYVPFVFMH